VKPTMRRRALSRRRFLAGAGTGAVAVAIGAQTTGPAGAAVSAEADGQMSTEVVQQLAEYADLPLPSGTAEVLATQLGRPLATFRAMRPAGYEGLLPAVIFTVPAGD